MENQITVFGATGFVGKQLVKQALQRGYKVKVLVRSKEKLGELSQKIEVLEGNYFDPAKIDEAIQGSLAVLSTIGPPMNAKEVNETQYHNALKQVLKSMELAGTQKFINISGAGIPYPGEQLPFARKMLRLLLKLMAKQMVKVKDEELEILFHSKINFTNVRPPMIKDAKGEYRTAENSFVGMEVGVEQICSFMLDNIEDNTWNRKAPLIGKK